MIAAVTASAIMRHLQDIELHTCDKVRGLAQDSLEALIGFLRGLGPKPAGAHVQEGLFVHKPNINLLAVAFACRQRFRCCGDAVAMQPCPALLSLTAAGSIALCLCLLQRIAAERATVLLAEPERAMASLASAKGMLVP